MLTRPETVAIRRDAFHAVESSNLTPGTYVVGQPNNGFTLSVLGIHDRDGTCKEIDHNATTGSLELDTVNSTSISGTITADIPGSGTLTVPFHASFCDTSTSTGAKQCLPP